MRIAIMLSIYLFIGQTVCFQTMNDLEQYLAQFPENFEAVEQSLSDPNYSKFYESITPGFFKRFFYKIKLFRKPLWDAYEFQQELLMYIEQRADLPQSKSCAIGLRVEENTNFVIWNDLHGAFHSLFRDLKELQNQGVINNNFEIINKNYYFVFNGNAINRSPYVLETLTIILKLMNRNSDRVFYIKGSEEDEITWQNFGLRRELQIKAGYISSEAIPLKDTIIELFNSLPLALYIQNKHEPENNVIRISYFDRTYEKLDEHYFGDFWSILLHKDYALHDCKNRQKSTSVPNIAVIIAGQEHIISKGSPVAMVNNNQNNSTYNLVIDFDQGAVSWSFLSCPVPVYQHFFKFFYDSFALVTTGASVDTTILTMYQRSILDQKKDFDRGYYNILSGQVLKAGEKPKPFGRPISMGSSMALTRGVFDMGQDVRSGIISPVIQQNQQGGIHNRLLRPVILDDEYNPNLARRNMRKLLLEDHIDTIIFPLGSPTLRSSLDLISSQSAVILFPVTGGPQFRDPKLNNIIHLRASYADEAAALIDYMVTEYEMHNFAFFYQNDAYGKGPLEAAHKQLLKHGIKEWTDVSYSRSDYDFKNAIDKLLKAQPEAIGFFSSADSTKAFIRQLDITPLIGKKLFGISFLGESFFRDFLNNHGLEFMFSQVVPDPQTSELEIVKEYRAEMDRVKHGYDPSSLEAFIGMSLLIDIMKKTEPNTSQELLKNLESIHDYNFKGIELTFNPQTRDLAKYVWLEVGPQEWKRYNADY